MKSRSWEVYVAGFPSSYGGADTELDHQIDLLRRYGVEVTLVPMFGCDPRMRDSVRARGCSVLDYRADAFKDKTVVSYCNGQFLTKLPDIMEKGRPRRVIWFNCMTHLFDAERVAHERGWIDYFGFVSNYQRRCLGPQLQAIGPYRTFNYRP